MKVVARFVASLSVIVFVIGGAVGLGAVLIESSPAGAITTITVNDAGDATPTPSNCVTPTEGDCTLRAALLQAAILDGDVTINLPDPNSVEFNHAPEYQVLSSLLLSSGTGTVTIDGAGEDTSVIQAQCTGPGCPINFGVLTESGLGNAVISGVTIEGGDIVGGSGGGIVNDGALAVENSSVSNNTSENVGGGIENDGTLTVTDSLLTGDNAGGRGGAIDQESDQSATLTLTDDTISDNFAGGDGGGVYAESGTVTISGGTIGGTGSTSPSDEGNSTDSNGGGLALEGAAGTISNVTFGGSDTTQGNSAVDLGGAVYISSGDPSFSGDTISNDTAHSEGGGVYIDGGTNSFTNETIENNTAGVADTDNGYGGGVYINDGTNTFTNDAVDGNVAVWVSGNTGYGGGLDVNGGTNTFTGGSIDANSAYVGGGLYLGNSITLDQVDISSNTASEAGGGIFDWTDGALETVTRSTISDNQVPTHAIGVTSYLGDGGGILSDYCQDIDLTNDTVTANSAPNLGGGFFSTNCSQPSGITTAFEFDTISGNTSGSGGGNISTNDLSELGIGESIVANGVSAGVAGTNCTFSGGGSITSAGYNLIDDSTCGTPAATDIIGKSAQLGTLANNGGPTQTELPASSSPAVGAVPSATCSSSGVRTDQRGVARGAGANGSCTIGAVEVAAATPPAPPSYNPNGYRLVADEGGIFDFGLNFNGSLANNKLNAPIVGLANSPGPNGYVMVGSDGGVFAEGGANFYGSLGGQSLPSPIAAIAAPPTETGYWLAAQNGKIYNFGSVPALPAVGLPAGAKIVGMASDTTGQGAWLVDQYGNVFAEGDALYEGGVTGHLNAPVVGIAAAASGQGYILVASDGGVFTYGVGFHGSVPGSLAAGQHLVAPIVGIAVTHSGNGYWEVGADGGVFNYGDAPFLGSIYTAIPGQKLNGPIVGIQHLGSAPV